MTPRQVRLGHCHRCIYTWVMRKRAPKVCPRCKSRLWRTPKLEPIRLGTGLGIEEIIGSHRAEILRIAARRGALTIRVFGSVRRREADRESDLDLLVDWSPKATLLDTVRFRCEVAGLLGRTVDVVTSDRLHWAVRPRVLREAVPI